MGVERKLSTSFHPQNDGQTERANGVLEDTLRHYINGTCTNWDEYLSTAEFAVNSATKKSTDIAPFEQVYGEMPLKPLALDHTLWTYNTGTEVAQRVADLVKEVRSNLDAARQRAKCLC